MLNSKRIVDLNELGFSDALTSESWIEIARRSTEHQWQPYKVSFQNFIASLVSRLSSLKLADESSFTYSTLPIGAVTYQLFELESTNFVKADGRFYTLDENASYYNVTYAKHIGPLFDVLCKSPASVIEFDIADVTSTQKLANDKQLVGKYLVDKVHKVVRMPNLNAAYLRSTIDLANGGRHIDASAPNIVGMFKACYHLFNKKAEVYVKLADDVKKMTNGAFSVNITDNIDKNYLETDLDLSNQDEKYDWISMLGQIIGFDASNCSDVYVDDGQIEVDAVKLVPYVCVNNEIAVVKKQS